MARGPLVSGPTYLSIVLRDPDTGAEVPIGNCIPGRDVGTWRVWIAMHGFDVTAIVVEPEDVSTVRSLAVAFAEAAAADAAKREAIIAEGRADAGKAARLERAKEHLARIAADAEAERAAKSR